VDLSQLVWKNFSIFGRDKKSDFRRGEEEMACGEWGKI